jgi:hypothetical protein
MGFLSCCRQVSVFCLRRSNGHLLLHTFHSLTDCMWLSCWHRRKSKASNVTSQTRLTLAGQENQWNLAGGSKVPELNFGNRKMGLQQNTNAEIQRNYLSRRCRLSLPFR